MPKSNKTRKQKGGTERALYINTRIKNGTENDWFLHLDNALSNDDEINIFYPEFMDYAVLEYKPFGFVGILYPFVKQYSSTREPGTYKRKRLQVEQDRYLRFEPRYLYKDMRALASSVLFNNNLTDSSDFVTGIESIIFHHPATNLSLPGGDLTENLYTFVLTVDAISGGSWSTWDIADGNDLYQLFSIEDEAGLTTREDVRAWLKSHFPKATDAAINKIPLFKYRSLLDEQDAVDNYIDTIAAFFNIHEDLSEEFLNFQVPNPNVNSPNIFGTSRKLGETADYKQFEKAIRASQELLKEKLKDIVEEFGNIEGAERKMAAKEAIEKEYPAGLANLIKSYGNFKKEPKLALDKLAKKNRKTRKSS